MFRAVPSRSFATPVLTRNLGQVRRCSTSLAGQSQTERSAGARDTGFVTQRNALRRKCIVRGREYHSSRKDSGSAAAATLNASPVADEAAALLQPLISFADGALRMRDGPGGEFVKIPGRWLRDNCSCPACRNTDTAQRQINVFKGTTNCDITNYEEQHSDGGSSLFTVTFGDGHKSVFPSTFLSHRDSPSTHEKRYGITPITTWAAADIASSPPTVSYSDALQAHGMSAVLTHIRSRGFCFIDDTPVTPEATESLLESIGPIRNTHYGGFYDFTSDLSSKDTAYTSEHLDPHTDNTYFTEPAGLQALHLLSHTGTGGASILVDGFHAASLLPRTAYNLLSSTPIYAHASGNSGISIQPSRPFPTLTHAHEPPQHLTQVRWNNADRAGIAAPMGELEEWYAAAALWEECLSDPKNQYVFQLRPGTVLVFDNWRVLHGRTAFEGKRRMCGAYVNRDDWISRFRFGVLSGEEVVRSTVTG